MATASAERGQWGSRLAFVLAASGSAIGLGNIWRFPYTTGANGGGAFVLVYVLCSVFIGLAVMWAELAIGRSTQKNPVGAFGVLAPGSIWKLVGYMGVLTGVGILSYYGVVAGWTLYYMFQTATGELAKGDSAKFFGEFVSDGTRQVVFLLVFMVITCLVVMGGIKKGIERLTKVLMPVLLLMLIGLIINGLLQPQASAGLKFYLVPDFDKFKPITFVYALGQAFFSLSLGMGAMLTYGSYMSKRDNIATAGVYVVIFDTLIALMAGLMIFPMLGGAPPAAGPGLVFVVLVKQFQIMPAGQWIGTLFFLLLAVAALTSTVSLLEVVVSFLVDERKMGRKTSVVVAGSGIALLGIPSALSLGANEWFTKMIYVKALKKHWGFLDILDFTVGNILLAAGAMLTALFVLFRWGVDNATSEISSSAPGFKKLRVVWVAGMVAAIGAVAVMLVYMLWTRKTLG